MRRESGKLVTHARCSKKRCGTTNTALIAHKKLARYLKQWNFETNPCDPFLWNAMAMNKQLTLLFHADDVMLTHEMANGVTDQIKLLDEVHGENDPLNVTRSKLHE